MEIAPVGYGSHAVSSPLTRPKHTTTTRHKEKDQANNTVSAQICLPNYLHQNVENVQHAVLIRSNPPAGGGLFVQ